MRLLLDREICDNCKKCLSECPNGLSSLNALSCKQCRIEDAECARACPSGAIYEAAEGILSIDSAACNGCGACASACSENAIQIIGGKAAKCDLCASGNFTISCARACGREAIEAVKPAKEIHETEKILGWFVQKIRRKEICAVLRDEKDYEIVNSENGKIYCLKEFPELTRQEARLVMDVVNEFREDGSCKKGNAVILSALQEYCSKNRIELGNDQKNYLLEVMDSMVFGFGPLSKLLSDDGIEEIAIIGIGSGKPVHIYDTEFGWLKTNIYFSSEDSVRNIVNRMGMRIGRRLTLQTPKLNAVLPDGSRLNACIAPVSFSGPAATIRKFRQRPFSPIDLVQNRTLGAEALSFLWMALQTDCSIVLAGNTGSGKTSTLNALFCFIPKEERIIVVEETPELNLPHSHIVKLNTAENLGIGMHSLIVDTLRMRPDRIIVGEIRSREEVSAFIDTMLAGQGKGSYATFHSQSAREALVRMKSLGICEIDLASIDLIIVQKRWNRIDLGKSRKEEIRRVVEICEVLEKGGTLLPNSLFEFNYSADRLERTGKPEKIVRKMEKTYGLCRKEIESEMLSRQKKIQCLAAGGLQQEELFECLNGGL